jgi:hypothetical protein
MANIERTCGPRCKKKADPRNCTILRVRAPYLFRYDFAKMAKEWTPRSFESGGPVAL